MDAYVEDMEMMFVESINDLGEVTGVGQLLILYCVDIKGQESEIIMPINLN